MKEWDVFFLSPLLDLVLLFNIFCLLLLLLLLLLLIIIIIIIIIILLLLFPLSSVFFVNVCINVLYPLIFFFMG